MSGWRGLERPSSRKKIEDEYDDGEYKEDVYPPAEGIAADESYNPEDD